jgi:hypothetical protein
LITEIQVCNVTNKGEARGDFIMLLTLWKHSTGDFLC